MTELAAVWHEVEKYILDDLSVIPVHEKNGIKPDGTPYYAKSPIGVWKHAQQKAYTKDELWKRLEKSNTTAVGIVCGKVSGNLEVIDVDSKYLPGIDAILFKDIQTFYPEIWPILRIHKTPSGGFHILYRTSSGTVPGNLKLAGRIPTEYEVQQDHIQNPQKKKDLDQINFLETRGEGGQFVAPPSLNYSVYQDNPIPEISWEQRCSLIELCRRYNQIIKEEVVYKPTKTDNDYYEVNPWQDFNNRVDPVELCTNNGWKVSGQNNNFVWFTRPGKEKGVSLSWNKEKHIFFSFSSSTDLDSDRGYNASSFLAIYQFNNDRKATHKWLVDNGYGQIKPRVEKQIIQRAKLKKEPVPGNLSTAAVEKLENLINEESEIHPYGIFWEISDDDKYSISRELLYGISFDLGFRLYNDEPVQIKGQFIELSDKSKYFDAIKQYIKEPEKIEYLKICNVLEAFLQVSGKYTIERLRALDTDYILKDTPDTCYKLYNNLIAEITEDNVNLLKYSDIDTMLVWSHKVLQREINPFDKAPAQFKYNTFLHHAIGVNEYLHQIIGYLAHDYKDENTGYIVTLTEKSPDPKGGGGSGKNIFGNLLREITTVCTVAGSQVQFSEKFLQAWNEERIFFMADVPKKFDFEYLKEMSTGYGIVKKLFKDDRTVGPGEMPKLLVNTNFSFDASDGGLKRRILPIEFTNFFTLCGGVDAHFGCMFPRGFDEQDWLGYDWFMFISIQKFFKCRGKITAIELSGTGWEKQFKQKFSELTYNFIIENINDWLFISDVKITDFNKEYNDYCLENNIQKTYQLSSIMMNRALKEYCERHIIDFEGNVTVTKNSIPEKCKTFHAKKEVAL